MILINKGGSFDPKHGRSFDLVNLINKQKLFTTTDRQGEMHLPNICRNSSQKWHSFLGPNSSIYSKNPDGSENTRPPRLNDDGSAITDPICKIDREAKIHDEKY